MIFNAYVSLLYIYIYTCLTATERAIHSKSLTLREDQSLVSSLESSTPRCMCVCVWVCAARAQMCICVRMCVFIYVCLCGCMCVWANQHFSVSITFFFSKHNSCYRNILGTLVVVKFGLLGFSDIITIASYLIPNLIFVYILNIYDL